MNTYATLADFIDQEIIPSLDGVGEHFNLTGLVEELRDNGQIVFEDGWSEEHHAFWLNYQGFRWSDAMHREFDGGSPLTFWALVQKYDS